MIYKIWDMVLLTSFYGTLVGLTIVIIKKLLGKKISPTWGYLIWMILILKLIVPFGPPSRFSIFNNMPLVTEQVENKNELSLDISHIKNDESYIESNKSSNYNYDIESQDNNNISLNSGNFIKDIIPYIWMVMSIGILVLVIYTNILFNLKINRNIIKINNLDNVLLKCTNKIKCGYKVKLIVTDYVNTPSITGLIRPKILLPLTLINLSEKEIEYILLHELAHYKRKDILVNYILIVLQAIHWFNPFIWYYFKQIKESMEYATDESVLNLLNDNEYKSYGMTLLNVISNIHLNRFNPSVMSMANDKKEVEKRLYNLKFSNLVKKKALVFKIIGMISVFAISLFTLTSSYTKIKEDSSVIDNEISKLDTTYIDIIEKVNEHVINEGEFKQIIKDNKMSNGGAFSQIDFTIPNIYDVDEHRIEYNGVLQYTVGNDSKSEIISIGYNDNNKKYFSSPIEYTARNTGIYSSYYPENNLFKISRSVQGIERKHRVISNLDTNIINSDIYKIYYELGALFNGKNAPNIKDLEDKLKLMDIDVESLDYSNNSVVMVPFDKGFIVIKKDYDNSEKVTGISMQYNEKQFKISISSEIRNNVDGNRVDSLNYTINYETTSEDKLKYLIPSIENALYK